jgi:A/G-specific adenine glycosylase
MRRALADWFAAAKRPLAWRTTPSLYGTVVSEFMCQQTQVATVAPYYAAWLRAFPTFDALAAADEATVMRHWEGLGYYSRARNLHRLARALVAMTDGPPRTAGAWQALPGIGPYTAAAIASLRFGDPVAVVDGNVVRVLSRLCGDDTPLRDSTAGLRRFRPLAEQLLDRSQPGQHNEALMELGALVCTKARPACTVCPWVAWCRAAARGNPTDFPRIERSRIEQLDINRLWLRDESGHLLLHRIPATARRLAGIYELPMLPAWLATADCQLLAIRQRGISNQRMREHIWQPLNGPVAVARVAALRDAADLAWLAPSQLPGVTLSGPHRKWITELCG